MGQTCIGLCDRVKTVTMSTSLRYEAGQKRCSLCAHFFYTKESRCPCCKTRLRSKPRNKNKG